MTHPAARPYRQASPAEQAMAANAHSRNSQGRSADRARQDLTATQDQNLGPADDMSER
jgi:hypothetical protein